MNFLKNIFKAEEQQVSDNYLLRWKEEHIDSYANSWVGHKIPELTESLSELIYRKDLDENVIKKFLNSEDASHLEGSGWSARGALNFPGPFYTGVTDTCGTGIIEAPCNVFFDDYCMEYVMIQPRNEIELIQLCSAAAVEVFGSYYCDGDQYWTLQSVRHWWSNKNELLKTLKNDELIRMNCNQEKRYKSYLENYAETDLRKYCYYLENGIYPSDETLPELK